MFAKGAASVSAIFNTKIEYVMTPGTFVSETDYYVYVTAADNERPERQTALQKILSAPPACPPPSLSASGPARGPSSTSAASFKLVVQLSEPGTVYYHVVPKGETPASASSARSLAVSGDPRRR